MTVSKLNNNVLAEMQKITAYKRNEPIIKSVQMKELLPFKKIDEDWKNRINDFWWGTGYSGDTSDIDGKVFMLRDKLLDFGGEEACMAFADPDIDNIIQYGQLWFGRTIKKMKGEPSKCHQNMAYLWNSNKDSHNLCICTGYALSDDGMWRQHSWGIWIRERTRILVETTVERIAYFGFAMNDELSEKFFFENE